MVTLDSRRKREFFENENFHQDMFATLEELIKLQEYYKSEVQQTQLDQRRIEENSPVYHYNVGRLEAYSDNIAELEYVIKMMRGLSKE